MFRVQGVLAQAVLLLLLGLAKANGSPAADPHSGNRDECDTDSDASWLQMRAAAKSPGLAAAQVPSEPVESAARPAKLAQLETATRAGNAPWYLSNFSRCDIDGANDCAMGTMSGPTLVYPGGQTMCLDGSPYAFIVVPGAADKLLFMFAGGGACWVAPLAPGGSVLMCQPNLVVAVNRSGFSSGIIDFANPLNPFLGYTLVFPMYCSGDGHSGNTTMPHGNITYQQRGYANAYTAVAWAKQNLNPVLTQFTLTGWSAGNLAVMAWGDQLLSTFKYESATVLSDSEVNWLPNNPATEIATTKNWGVCDGAWSSDPGCPTSQQTIQEYFLQTIRKHRDVAFGSVESKQDHRQKEFYDGFAASLGLNSQTNISGAQFYDGTVQYFSLWWAEPNYVAYFLDGDQHCPTVFLDADTFYTSTPDGPNTIDTSSGTPLYKWVAGLVAHLAILSECSGPVVHSVESNPDGCSSQLPPKVLQVSSPQ